MQGKLIKLARTGAMLALVVGLITPMTGYAGREGEDDPQRKGDKDKTEQARSQKEDHELRGQVLEINTLKDPPELQVANVDGVATVRLLTKDLVEKTALRTGDHVTLVGEKISEVAFDAQEMSVDGHLGDDLDNNDDDN
jgi:hypothetical protein